MTPEKNVQETLRRILQQTTLRAILLPIGRTPLDVTQAEADALLEPYEAAIENDYQMCLEVSGQLIALAAHGQQDEEELAPDAPLVLESEE